MPMFHVWLTLAFHLFVTLLFGFGSGFFGFVFFFPSLE